MYSSWLRALSGAICVPVETFISSLSSCHGWLKYILLIAAKLNGTITLRKVDSKAFTEDVLTFNS